ncbi:MAG: Crp/Fnr family transcriptional regulator [Bryobacteraceae bacterium]
MSARSVETSHERGLSIALPPPETYHAGIDLCAQGKPAKSVCYVVEGVVKLTHVRADGRQIILDLTFPGELIGADAALLGEECLETATTVTDCGIARWGLPEFRARFEREPGFLMEAMRVLCRQMGRHRCRITELGFETGRERLEALLRRWPGAAVGFDLPLNREEIGQVLLISSYHVSRLLGELEQDRVIRREMRRIRVQPVALWRAAAQRA